MAGTAVNGLSLERKGSTLVATIENPPDNIFTALMIDALADAIGAADADGETRFVRLQARGEVFCVGRERGGRTVEELRAEASRIVRLSETCRTTSLIVVVEVPGDAAGFGVGLVAAADVAIAAQPAQFWFPELLAGLAPTIVISWLGALVGTKRAFDLVSTGRKFSTAEALADGLLTEVVAGDGLSARVDERIAELEAMSRQGLRDVKSFLARIRSLDAVAAAQASIDPLVVGALRNAHHDL